MGNRKFRDFLKDLGYQTKKTYLQKYRDKIVAVDTFYHIYESVKYYGNVVDGIINLLDKLLSNGIKPIMVLDGYPSHDKCNAINERQFEKNNALKELLRKIRNENLDINEVNNIKFYDMDDVKSKKHLFDLRKNAYKINDKDIDFVKKIIYFLGVPFIHCKYIEADIVCKYLMDNNRVDYVLSSDIDMLAFGCDKVIRFNSYKYDIIEEYNLTEIKRLLELSQTQIIDIFILLGCDYYGKYEYNIDKMSNKHIYNLIKTYGSLINIILFRNVLDVKKYYKTHKIYNKKLKYVKAYYKSLKTNVIEIVNDITTLYNNYGLVMGKQTIAEINKIYQHA